MLMTVRYTKSTSTPPRRGDTGVVGITDYAVKQLADLVHYRPSEGRGQHRAGRRPSVRSSPSRPSPT